MVLAVFGGFQRFFRLFQSGHGRGFIGAEPIQRGFRLGDLFLEGVAFILQFALPGLGGAERIP